MGNGRMGGVDGGVVACVVTVDGDVVVVVGGCWWLVACMMVDGSR